jgi:hypothetical protein
MRLLYARRPPWVRRGAGESRLGDEGDDGDDVVVVVYFLFTISLLLLTFWQLS